MNWPKKLSAGIISLMMAIPSNAIGILAQEVEEEPITEEEVVEVVEEATIEEEAPVEITEEETVVEEEEAVEEEITEEVPEEETVEIVEEAPAEDEEVVEVVEEETEVVELEEGEPEPEQEPEPTEPVVQVLSIIANTAVADSNRAAESFEITVDDATKIADLKAEDFDVLNNGTNDLVTPAGEAGIRYEDDGIALSFEGNVLTISVKPFRYLGIYEANGSTTPWEVQCTKYPELSFKAEDVTELKTKTLDDFVRGEYTYAGLTRKYALYTPKDGEGNPKKNVPLVIWNHGGGEYNIDIEETLIANRGVTAWNEEGYECAVLMIQVANANYSYQTASNENKKKLIDQNNALQAAIVRDLIADGTVDESRVYVTGCSSGGGATMRFLMQYPDMFAGAIAMCSMDPIVNVHRWPRGVTPDTEDVITGKFEDAWENGNVYTWDESTNEMVSKPVDTQALLNVPIAFTHADNDGTCRKTSSVTMDAAMKNLGDQNNITRFYSNDEMAANGISSSFYGGALLHWSWVPVLNHPEEGEPMAWLFQQKKNIAEGTQTVNLTGDDWGAGIDRTIVELDKEIDALDKTYGATDAPDFCVYQTTYNNALQARTITAAYTSDAEGNKSGASKYVTLELRITPAEGNPILWNGNTWSNNWADPFKLKVVLANGSSITSGGEALSGLKVESAIEMPLGENVTIPQLEGYKFDTYTTVNEDNAGLTIPYGLYTPADDDHKNALVIWNHGVGERGTDPRIAILGNEVTALNSEEFQTIFDGAYVLVPQTPTNTGGKDIVKGKIELIEKIVAENPDIDPDRVIVGGCSMGGGQTMNIIYSRPDIFAAAYPVCPASTSSQVTDEQIKNISGLPIWFIHCTIDDTVNYAQTTEDLVKRLKAAGSTTVHTSLFDDVHDTTGRFDDLNDGQPYQYATHWSWVYFDNNECNEGDLNCWEWLAQQNRKNNYKPGVEVDGDKVTLTYKDADVKDAVKVTFTGNFQWFKWDEVGDFQAMGDNSGIPCYDADHYEEGMFNASGGLNNDTAVYELEEVSDDVFMFSFKLPGNLYFYDYTVEYADGTKVTMKDPGNMPKTNPATGSDAGHSLFYVGDAKNTTKGQEYIYARTDEKKGTYKFVPYEAIDGTEQYIGIYLPYGYDESKKYKTVYISHGGGGNEEEWMSIGAVPNILDNLIADGEVEPTIAVTMDNTYFNWDYTKVLPNVVDYIIPCVEENFAVSTEANDRAFCGLSMGSMTTNEMAKTYPNEFGYFGSFSGGSQDLDGTHYDVEALNKSVLYLTAGAVDMAYNNKMGIASVDYMKMYDELGVNYSFDLLGGAHDWGVWRESFTIFAKDYLWTPLPIEAKFAGIVTDAGEYVDYMTVDFGDAEISGVDKDTFKVMMTSTVDYGAAKGQPYKYFDATKPLKVVKTEVEGGLVKVYFQQDQAPVLTWLDEGRNYPAILNFTVTQEKPITVTVDGAATECTGKYFSVAKSWKDLANEELAKFEDVQDEINYQFHKGTNEKLIVFFHGNGEGDFPVKDTNNNIAQILANRGGAAWVSEEAQEVFGDASVMAFQAPNMWYFAIKDNLLEPCYNEIQKVIEENNIDPNEVYLSGASAGGFMSTRMIIAYPDLFKAAMINCPALDAANARSGSDDAIPTDEELAQLKDSKTAIWLVQGETDSSVDPELCSKRIWNIITEGEEVSEKEYEGDKGIASGFTTYETKDGKYKLSLYKTYDLDNVTGISGETRKGGKLLFAEDYDQDGVYTEVKYSDHWSWIYTLRDNPEAADGTHIWEWAVNYTENKFLFDDVQDETKSFYEPVYWAYKNGITTGTSTEPPLFSPFATCTRAQFVTFLWRQQGKPEPTLTESPFVDVQNKDLSYYKAVLWAVEKEITTGTSPTTFDPGKKVTRAQAVTFLWRANNKPAPKTTVNPFKDVAAGLSYSDAVLWAFENEITTGTSATTFNPGGDCTRGATVTFLWRTYAKN